MSRILDQNGREIDEVEFHESCNGIDLGSKRRRYKAAYDAANENGVEDWFSAFKSEDKLYLKHRKKIAARAADAYRNDALTQGTINEKVNLCITDNWRVRPNPDSSVFPGLSSKDLKTFTTDWRKKFTIDMKSRRKWIDASGKNTFLDLLRVDLLTSIVRGESFVKFNDIEKPRGSLGFNMAVIEPERVATPERFKDDATVKDGIRTSTSGYQQGYYIHKFHISQKQDNPFVLVPAVNEFGKVQVVHNMIQWTPELTRGMSQLVANLVDIKKKGIMKDAALEDMIAKAQIALVIRSNKSDIAEMFDMTEGDAGEMQSQIEQYMDECYDHHSDLGQMKHGNKPILRLFDGEMLDGFSPANSAGTFKDFCDYLNAEQARPYGLSAEMATQRWNDTNFSGARAGMISVKRNTAVQRQRVPENTSQCVWERWLADAFLRGKIEMPGIPDQLKAHVFFMENVDAIGCATWTGGAWEEIDPVKTAATYNLHKSIGIATYTRAANELVNQEFEDLLDEKFYELECINERLEAGGYPKIADPVKFLFPDNDLVTDLMMKEGFNSNE